ncbi:uncharacterized protein EDB93DRAFT_1082693 [Suillus bovinus]|uniref:uncharacterized protein n=1 Tax=Suillus bovinus TaxID=48563 RepID=UPI001B8700DB|nr:uncharacterized protein EDB93DRAFT_1082693 [Suillus bovinus]KAG2153114.1 hypothetical protein EDB93DRAFT_1082693 [Suillus bovinus]
MTRDYSIELRLAPSIDEARHAYMDLRALLKPPRSDGVGYKDPPKLNTVLKERLERMRDFLWLYTNITESDSGPCPANPVDQVACNTGKAHGTYLSRCLRSWSKAYIKDCNAFPIHRKPRKLSCIYDESLAADLKLHLQSVGKYVRAQDLIDYLNVPENQAHHGFTKMISPRTAQRWMNHLGYCWKKEPKGQYSDGHEQEDVVYFRQNVFLPAWNHYQTRMTKWNQEGDITVEDIETNGTTLSSCWVIMWFHDELTFYAHDRRKQRWVHSSKGAIPQPKGEGVSLMVADFVSADYGWLRSPDGEESS